MSETFSATLQPRAPFDFQRSLDFAAGFAPTRAETSSESGQLRAVLSQQGQALQLSLRAEEQHLQLEVRGPAGLDHADLDRAAVTDRARFWLSLDDDLTHFYTLAEADVPFKPVLSALYGYHQLKFLTPFEALSWAMLAQRTPQAVARGLKRALATRFGPAYEGQHAFPEAGALADAGSSALREVLPEVKAERLYQAALAFGQVSEEWLRSGPLEEVREWLLALPGVGPFSASLTLIRGLGRMTAGVEGRGADFERLLEAARRVYGPALDAAGLEGLMQHYGEARGYWAHYLRAVSDSGR